MQVATSDDSDILRHTETGFEDGVESAHGEWIVITENSVRSWIASQQEAHRLGALLKAVGVYNGTADDVILGTGKTPVEQGFAVALEPARAGAVFRPANVCHAPATN